MIVSNTISPITNVVVYDDYDRKSKWRSNQRNLQHIKKKKESGLPFYFPLIK
jgi:hypothetical protein